MVFKSSALATEFPRKPTPRPNALADDNSEFVLCFFKVLNKGDVGFIVSAFRGVIWPNLTRSVLRFRLHKVSF